MKHAGRITAMILAVCMLFGCSVFAATPKASIVSPAVNTVVTGDSLLVSVKVADKSSVKVYIFEEQLGDKAVDVKDFTENEVKAVYDDYLDVLAKLSAVPREAASQSEKPAEEANAENAEPKETSGAAVTSSAIISQKYTDVEYTSAAAFTASGELGFFTKQLTSVKPGLYRIQVDVIDGEGNATESVCNFVAVKEKPAETKSDIFETQQTGAMQFLSNLLKSLFR